MLQYPHNNENRDRPHYPLNRVKKLLSNPKFREITSSSRRDAYLLGFVDDDIFAVVNRLSDSTIKNGGNFFKSICVNPAINLWQDIYKIEISDEENSSKIYIKLLIKNNKGVVISFKKDEEWYP